MGAVLLLMCCQCVANVLLMCCLANVLRMFQVVEEV